jgi:hypothetical protein
MSICGSGAMFSAVVIPGLVPGIQPSTSIEASGTMDPGDKHRDDNRVDVDANVRGCLRALLHHRLPAVPVGMHPM